MTSNRGSAQLDPRRGEIWMVNLDPTRGDEIQKRRPAVVISSTGLGRLRLRVVVPLTSSWRGDLNSSYWMVPIPASAMNGLTQDSTADALQVRSVSLERFTGQRGQLEADLLEQVVAAVGVVIEL
ncbi:type II toxin-antitoxin system PemK/MazF family toxin [Deinococcus antarcticus]|uniref:mRNA interferase n=1 Tax=Deinococcus antarcticus TaxID=1298767 RepID=A0ABV8A4U4_9DEIO